MNRHRRTSIPISMSLDAPDRKPGSVGHLGMCQSLPYFFPRLTHKAFPACNIQEVYGTDTSSYLTLQNRTILNYYQSPDLETPVSWEQIVHFSKGLCKVSHRRNPFAFPVLVTYQKRTRCVLNCPIHSQEPRPVCPLDQIFTAAE